MSRRSVETFIGTQQEFLKIAGKKTHTWVEAAKAGQKLFIDVVAEETTKAISSEPVNGVKKGKKTELSEIAREATVSLIYAQKKLVAVAGRQMNAGVKRTDKAVGLLKPLPFPPLADLTREGVKSYIAAQNALVDVVVNGQHKAASKVEHRDNRSAKAKTVAAVA